MCFHGAGGETIQRRSGKAIADRNSCAHEQQQEQRRPARARRQNRQRLDFEQTRDALLFAAGQLDLTVGGRPVDIGSSQATRRSVYGFIDRQNLPGMFRTFDFASPDATNAQRFNTTVPQQALFMMNSPFAIEQSRKLASRPEVVKESDPTARITDIRRVVTVIKDGTVYDAAALYEALGVKPEK